MIIDPTWSQISLLRFWWKTSNLKKKINNDVIFYSGCYMKSRQDSVNEFLDYPWLKEGFIAWGILTRRNEVFPFSSIGIQCCPLGIPVEFVINITEGDQPIALVIGGSCLTTILHQWTQLEESTLFSSVDKVSGSALHVLMEPLSYQPWMPNSDKRSSFRQTAPCRVEVLMLIPNTQCWLYWSGSKF